jgi:hypothetical protein
MLLLLLLAISGHGTLSCMQLTSVPMTTQHKAADSGTGNAVALPMKHVEDAKTPLGHVPADDSLPHT